MLGIASSSCYGSAPMAFNDLQADLEQLGDRERRRVLAPRRGLDLASNDYLGLAGSDRLRHAVSDALGRGVAIGSGGSRLLRGNAPEHEALEVEAARFFGAEAALFTGGGYAANAMLLSTLPQRGDLVIHDELIHASAHEGMRLGRAERVAFAHNDVAAAANAIARWRRDGGAGTPWIAVESLYSMDGDQAPLAELAVLAEREGAMLLVDEAHATGVFGPDGRGLTAGLRDRANLVTLHTCGKALGCEGALILGPAVVRDFLINRGRAFIYSTAPSPLMAEAVRNALAILHDEPERRSRLHALIRHAEAELAPLGVRATRSPILPLIIGDDRRTMEIAGALQARGFDVRGVRPPTVSPGTSRLRISITNNVDEAAISALATALRDLL
ncbi:MAG: 8-amino-7-oxononanoate synthase [uncultured Sphingomonadaceae bacterium]|uniref:8-amino-7-oxononanoate synthase n=1 Tax=uncultured Sphingomonadaceae bacterium TaxID=169976 RepID=A0A6J4U5P4_9SPHN|nr:MAG: 8-amino-7-oxononanoate synthase [uncultured Sphingomonadaceae bacterium]